MTQPRLLGGRYELDGVVGRGGMAEVYRARDLRLDRIVAVKTLREDLARDQTFQARFRREAQSAASLNHPSIVAVYDTGEDMAGPSPVPYIVMEYVDGRTLRDLLREDRRLLPERAMEITDGTLRALEYSHRNGIVHRDIKPGNVMLTRNGDVKVMDFGIARAVSDAQSTMTQTAQVIGTAQYLSPEQARGERVDARSDLYSTGCLLYELLTGRPPFTGDSPVAIAYQHVREQPIPPSRVDPEIPAWADAIVLKAMAKDAGDRYQSAAEMHQDIQRALSGMPVAAPTRADMYAGTRAMTPGMMPAGPTSAIPAYRYGPQDQPPGREGRRRGWLWAVIALVAALVLGGGYFVFHYVSSNGGSISVPTVAGKTVNTAAHRIVKAKLLVGEKIEQASETVKSGRIIKTSPAEGSLVAPGSKVTLYVSTGPAQKQVPNVIGKSDHDAEDAITAAGFNVGHVTTDSTSTETAGTVIRQSPGGGSQATPGTSVNLTISGGAVHVPSVVGETEGQATAELSQAGLSFTVVTVPDRPGVAPGTVLNQNPAAGSTVPPQTQVTLQVTGSDTASPTPSPTPSTPTPSPTPSTPPDGQSPSTPPSPALSHRLH
jgi:beta-lactam-binding protein with PASTA domain/tRNA A-37 threonylcarbamoyl transferase component Bud32